MPKLKWIILMLLCGVTHCYAQQSAPDSTVGSPVKNVLNYFASTVSAQSGLYNGEEYNFYSRNREDNVFYQNQVVFSPGIVNYDGTTYNNIPLMYDLYLKQVVSLYYDGYSTYILHNEKISSFTYLNHHFVYRASDSLNTNGLQPGIYEQLYNGPSEELVSRVKKLLVVSRQQNTYPETDKIYIKNGSKYYEVSNKHNLLDALKDRKVELRKFISASNLNFTDDKEQDVAKVLLQYDKLNQ